MEEFYSKMKCYYCGNDLTEKARLCEACGKSQLITRKLIDDASRGDQDAFNRIYALTWKGLDESLKCMVKDEDSRRDILQETYLKAYLNLSTVKDPDKFHSWIRRIAHNEAVNYLNARNRLHLKEVPYESEEEWTEEEYRAENLPELQLNQKETARLMKKIVGCLSREQRIVVELYYEDEYRVSEIAQMLCVSESTVKSRLYYARRKLEVRVRKLEKQGISLRGLAPIPFVTAVLRSYETDTSAAEVPAMPQELREQLAQTVSQAAGISEKAKRGEIAPALQETGRVSQQMRSSSAQQTAGQTEIQTTAQTVLQSAEKAAALGQAEGVAQGISRLAEAGGAIFAGAKMLFTATGKGIAVNVAAIAVAVGVAGGLSAYNNNTANSSAAETSRMEASFEASTGETEEETEAQTETQTETVIIAQTAAYDPEETSQETKAATNLHTDEEKKEENRMSRDYSCDDNGGNWTVWRSDLLRETIAEVTFLGNIEDAPEDAWDVSENDDGGVLAWVTDAGDGLYHLYVAADGGVAAPAECRNMFGNFTFLKKITFGDNFDTSDVTSMQGMFSCCYQLEEIDIEHLDTSCVTDMSKMFDASGLESLDLANFDTSSVITMEAMFSQCEALTSLNLESFDTSNVTDMNSMFSGCFSLAELDLSGFDTSAVTNFSGMFSYCHSLKELDLGSFDTSSALTMIKMFSGCTSLSALDLSSFDTSKVAYMKMMFQDCETLEYLDLSGFDTSRVTDMSYMFYGCYSLTELDVSGFDTSLVTDMSLMFANCSSLQKLDLSGFDWSNVINKDGMLDGISAEVIY